MSKIKFLMNIKCVQQEFKVGDIVDAVIDEDGIAWTELNDGNDLMIFQNEYEEI
jgi:hypothetical protein